jgi:Zn-dependent protease
MLNTLFTDPFSFLLLFIALAITVTIHEFAHAITADKLGDPTPRLQGRVTLNPLKHLDPFGTLFLILVGFGWGRPVEFDPYNLKDSRRDAAIISIAGPVSNFILAGILALVFRSMPEGPLAFNSTSELLVLFLYQLLFYNVVLGVFNLLPIHPLDGFKIVGGLLPHDKAREWFDLQRYGFIFLILLIIPLGQSSMLDSVLRPLVSSIMEFLL